MTPKQPWWAMPAALALGIGLLAAFVYVGLSASAYQDNAMSSLEWKGPGSR